MARATKKQIEQAVESIAANVRFEAPASEWVANINYQIDVLRLDEPWSAATKIAAALGLDWATLVQQTNGRERGN